MQTFEYIHTDIPAGLDLREWRRTLEIKPRRRLRIPHLRFRLA